MTAFIDTYGTLILAGAILLFLLVAFSRRGHQPEHNRETGGHDENSRRHSGCC